MARVNIPPVAQSVPERAAERILAAWGSWAAFNADLQEYVTQELAKRERAALVARKNREIEEGLAAIENPFTGA